MSRWLIVVFVVLAVFVPGSAIAARETSPPTTVVDNEFIPEDRDLSDCISAVPEPGCGSEGRSGWRQLLIFGALVAGLAFIAWRVVRTARRQRSRT